MKDVLKKGRLRIIDVNLLDGKEMLEGLEQNKERRYPLRGRVHLEVVTNQGTLTVTTGAGFEFDGRSGPSIIDFYVPNLGSLEEKVCWLVHDCNGYATGLSFKDTNILLYAMLRYYAKYKPAKANVIQLAVSLSKSWYGVPAEDDWCHRNIGLVNTSWEAKC